MTEAHNSFWVPATAIPPSRARTESNPRDLHAGMLPSDEETVIGCENRVRASIASDLSVANAVH